MITFAQTTVQAKELTNRLGVGYSNEMSVDLPSIAAQYYPSPELGLSAALGVETGDDLSNFGLLIKVYRIIFPEDHMNFYMGAGAGLLSTKVDDDNESGFELSGFVGGEFFIPGIDSLGFSFEGGIGIVSLSSGVEFRTIGHHPLQAGMIFYF
ncbi:MAG: organic solvent tolerance protein [Bdellovibrionales bacterium]|nr:organic solvent tolerance protein [Bdellovibrionales bacterium]